MAEKGKVSVPMLAATDHDSLHLANTVPLLLLTSFGCKASSEPPNH